MATTGNMNLIIDKPSDVENFPGYLTIQVDRRLISIGRPVGLERFGYMDRPDDRGRLTPKSHSLVTSLLSDEVLYGIDSITVGVDYLSPALNSHGTLMLSGYVRIILNEIARVYSQRLLVYLRTERFTERDVQEIRRATEDIDRASGGSFVPVRPPARVLLAKAS